MPPRLRRNYVAIRGTGKSGGGRTLSEYRASLPSRRNAIPASAAVDGSADPSPQPLPLLIYRSPQLQSFLWGVPFP
jgi:hypothetical protein